MRESIPDPLRLRLSGPTGVHDATVAVRHFAESAGLDPRIVSRIAIVVEELATNLYDHGQLELDDVFEIEVSLTDIEITVVLIDHGKPFDPSLARFYRTIPSRGGGAGLKLVRAWASQIDYQTGEGANRLAVRLRLHA